MSATVPNTRLHVSALMRAAWPANTAKHAARASGQSPRTAEAWVAQRAQPSAATLLRMADACDRFAEQLERRLHARRRAAGADQDVARSGAVPAGLGATEPLT